MRLRPAIFVAVLFLAIGCGHPPTSVPSESAEGALAQSGFDVRSQQPVSSVRWNRKAIALFRLRGGDALRPGSYLSLAQYRAVRAAGRDLPKATRPALAGAAAGASVVVLQRFYALDGVDIDAELELQRAAFAGGGPPHQDFAAGEAIGRLIGVAVLAEAATDNFGMTSPGLPPAGPGYWTSSAAPIVRGGLGARPFFLTSGSELRTVIPPPPPFGSATYLDALAEVRAIAANRTAEQVALVLKWVPFSGVLFNGIATDLIEKYRRSELDAARILAYANAASYDAIVACFDVKYTYWFIRPSQADPSISLATGLPNHPSYPSAHSCQTGGFQEVLTAAFPQERAMLDRTAREASWSRVLGGLHYSFDGDAGLSLGRAAGRLALARKGLE